MNIARFAVSRPVLVTMQIASLVLLGAVCLTRLPVDLLPEVTLPTISITTIWPNVAPEEIEAQVTRPLERAVSSVPNMYEVSSSSVEGTSTVRVQFRWGTDIGEATIDVLQQIERARRSFPTDPTLQTPTVRKFDPSQMPIMTFGVSGIDDLVKLRALLDNHVTPILDSADGVASASVSGGLERAILVDVDKNRLQAHHISLSDVVRRISQENLNMPAGIAKQGKTEYTIRSLGWFKSPDEIASVPVGSFDGKLVSLADVATIKDSHDEPRTYTRLNGRPAVSLSISKQSGANTISTAKAVYEKTRLAKRIYPELEFGLVRDQSQYILKSITYVRDSAIIGGVLAVLILLFFLRNVRSTMVVALSIPISIISTFALVYLCGFTINTMSLGGLALATGLIVDDAVVVLENIFRHIEREKKKTIDAAVSGTNEILSAVIASTWTVMVVFLPLLLIKGQAGQMYAQFALVVIFSLFVSLIDAITIVPMLSTRLISGEAHHENMNSLGERQGLLMRAFRRCGEWLSALDAAYRGGLAWAIHHRIKTVCLAVGVTLASLLLFPLIGTELMPASDSGDFVISVKMPVGTALSETDQAVRRVEEIVMRDPNVQTVIATAGTSRGWGGGASRPFQGSLTVRLKEGRSVSTLDVIRSTRRQLAQIPGLNARPQEIDIVARMMTGGGESIEVNVFGDDLTELSRLSQEVMQRVRPVPGLENLDVNWEEAMPEIQWKVDRQKALQMGASFRDIGETIDTATNGTIASYYQEGGFQYPIMVRLPESQRKTVAAMQDIVVRPGAAGTGQSILLRQVATPVYGLGPSEITRLDRRRYVAVTGVPQGRSSGEVQSDISGALAGLQMPSGYNWDWGRRQKQQAEEFGGLWLAVAMAVVLIYMFLASQFESFVHPLTILLSVPLAGSGVILGLFLTGRSFGLTAFIGLLMLVGIVVKNGILLVDYTNKLRERGMVREEALLNAGPTRLRPILMTASASVFGMLPLAMGIGEGSEIQAPMATAVIGGLITSTALTLFVVPVVYSVLDDLAIRIRGKRQNG